MLSGALLMIALFNFAFYFLRRSTASYLFLGMFCATAALRIVSTGERYLLRVIPDLSWEALNKIEYMSWFLLLPFFAHFLQSLYHREFDRRALYVLDGVSLFAIIIVAATGIAIFSYIAPVMELIHLAALLYGGFILVLARKHRRAGVNISLLGFLFFFICAVNDLLRAAWIIETPILTDVGILGFAICQSLLSSIDFATSVSTVETQYKQLATSSLKLQTQEKLRLEAEIQSRKVLARFRESQQFEALGILAHGVVSELKASFDDAASETEKLTEALKSRPELLTTLEKTKKAANRSVAVIEDLLSLSTFDTESHASDINQIISDYLETPKVVTLAEQNGVVMEQQLSPAIQPVVGTKLHIQRILENLMTNAFDSQQTGGRTTVSTEQIYTDGRTLYYDSIKSGYYVLLSVSDTGISIHPEDLDSIFQPFFTRRETEKENTGLGLSVVRAIVKQLGGGIDVISEASQGTRFDIYLHVSLPSRAS